VFRLVDKKFYLLTYLTYLIVK